jgi:glutamate carboxypeptidase
MKRGKNMVETDMVKVKQYIEAHTNDIVEKYKELINLQDFWRNTDAVASVAKWLEEEFTNEGATCKLIETGEKSGPIFTGIFGKELPGKPVMFCGHMDTALDSALYSESPFYIKEGKAYGPGVLDMKGGIIISLYVLKAMKYAGNIHRPIQFLYAPDEEGCHLYSHVPDYIQKHSENCLFAFNMETGLVNNSLCTGRKGRIGVDISIEGIEAHAGNDFTAGINAIEEAAYKILDFLV